MVIQKLTTDIDRVKIVRNEEMETRNKHSELLLGNVPVTTTHDSNAILHITYTSAVRFSEGHLPHNLVIPNYDKRQTGPKMTTISPPQIPR